MNVVVVEENDKCESEFGAMNVNHFLPHSDGLNIKLVKY